MIKTIIWSMLGFGVIALLFFITYRITENTKIFIEEGYCQKQKLGDYGIIWTNCNE